MRPFHAHLVLLVWSLATTVAVGVLYNYMFRTVQTSANRALVAESLVKAQQQSNVDQKNTQAMFENTALDRARLTGFFISTDNEVVFIESLEKVGAAAGSTAELSGVAADDPLTLKTGSSANIKAHVSANGSWSSIMRTLELSEVLPYQSSVSNVSLSSSMDSSEKVPKSLWHISYDVSASLLGTSSNLKK